MQRFWQTGTRQFRRDRRVLQRELRRHVSDVRKDRCEWQGHAPTVPVPEARSARRAGQRADQMEFHEVPRQSRGRSRRAARLDDEARADRSGDRSRIGLNAHGHLLQIHSSARRAPHLQLETQHATARKGRAARERRGSGDRCGVGAQLPILRSESRHQTLGPRAVRGNAPIGGGCGPFVAVCI